MPTYQGKVQRSEFGGGWELHTDAGEVYELAGGGGLTDGARVEVSGSVDRGAMSLSMRGPILKVTSIKRIR
jgi:hypothetical protein